MSFSRNLKSVSAALLIVGLAVIGTSISNLAQQSRKPDLVIRTIALEPESPEPGDGVTINAIVANQGEGDVRSRFHVQFKIDDMQVAVERLSGLRAGEEKEVKTEWKAIAGIHQISVTAGSPFDRIDETDEHNNESKVKLHVTRPDFMLGVDANFFLDMHRGGYVWKENGVEVDPLAVFADKGVGWLRVRVWTNTEGHSGLRYASEVVTWAKRSGLRPYLVLFLSDRWADMTNQPTPAAWQRLSLQERAQAIHEYCRDTVLHFEELGVDSSLYEIGNEIDYGISGIFVEDEEKREDEEWMRENIWLDEAFLINACEKGIREVDPDAKFLLHIGHWWDSEFVIAFFRAMMDFGVQVDYTGLSFYPSPGYPSVELNTLQQFIPRLSTITKALGKPLIIAEYAYPSTSEIGGMWENWNKASPGYPLTPQGQRDWLVDFLTLSYNHAQIAGVFYWSPDWYAIDEYWGVAAWEPFSMLSLNANAKPALEAFKAFRDP